jgi:uroporphyrinogen-III decarboxylase
LTEEKSRVGVLENAPPWWPNFKPPEFSEEESWRIERICKRIVENVNEEKGMTPWERLKVTREMGMPDRPFLHMLQLVLAEARALDNWSQSLLPGIDMWWYPKLHIEGSLLWTATFKIDDVFPYQFTYGEVEWGGSSKAKLVPYAAPAVIDPAVKSPEDWDRIHVPDVYRDGFYPPSLWVLKKTKEFMRKHGVADLMPLWGSFCADPYGSVEFHIGMKQYLMAIRRNPEVVHKSCELSTKHSINYAKAVLEAGADVMQCCSWPGIAGLEAYKPFDKYTLEITRAVGPTNFHWAPAFDNSETFPYMCETGSMPFMWLTSYETPLEVSRRVATKYKKVFAWQFDSLILAHPDQPKIEATVKNTIKTGAGPGFIESIGAIDYWTPKENIDFSMKTAKEYGRELYKGLK